MAFGAIALPTKPANKTTVKTYGIAWINCTGTMPMPGKGTPCSRICKASVKPNNKQAIRAVLGFHFPNISAANARYPRPADISLKKLAFIAVDKWAPAKAIKTPLIANAL